MASGSSVGSTHNASRQPRSLPRTASSNYDENWRGARPKSHDTWRRQGGSRTNREETVSRSEAGFDCLRAGASFKEEDNPDSRSRFRGDRPSNYRRGQRFRESPHTHQGYRNPNDDASWKRTGNRDEHSQTWRNQRGAQNSYGESRPFDSIRNRNKNKTTTPQTGTWEFLDQDSPADRWRSSLKSDNRSSRVEHSGSSQESESSRVGVTPSFSRRPGKAANQKGANETEDPRTEDFDLPPSSNSAKDDAESPVMTFVDSHSDESGRRLEEAQQSPAQSPRKPQAAKRDLKTLPFTDRELRRFFVEKPTEVLTKLVAGKEKLLALLNLDELSADTVILTVRVLSCMWYLDPASEGLYTLELNTVLSLIESSSFLSKHLTRYLAWLSTKQSDDNDANDVQSLSSDVKMIFELLQLFLQHKPSRFSDVGVPLILLQKVVTTTALNDAAFDPESSLMIQVQQLSECCNSLEQDQKRVRQRATEKPPPNNFRDIPVFPESTEIRQMAKPFLRKNIIRGRYDNVEHYLDVQFRLLREDFVAPLREGVTEYLAHTTGRLQDIRLYYNVFIEKQMLGNSGVTHTLKFEMKNRNCRPERWEKRLMYGSFVCLSNDDFQNILCATVENRNPNDLAKGSVNVRFLTKPPRTLSGPFIMAESAAYFEAYRHVLLGLQQTNDDNFPFKKYIVDVASSVDPPVYLRDDDSVTYDLRALVVGTAETFDYDREAESYVKAAFVPILYSEKWPTAEELHLDESQKTALQTALTNEFSIIQGPPGTGKTFIGLKIIQILLDNSHLPQDNGRSPILVVCYTNHALDQFLEGIIALGEGNVVRVGGRSSSEVLESKNINSLRRERSMEEHKRFKREFYEVRAQLQEAEKTIKRTLTKLDVSRIVILDIMVMRGYMREIHYKNLTEQRQRGKNTEEDPSTNLLKWLKVDYSTDEKDSGPPGKAKETSPGGEGHDRTSVGDDVLQQEHQLKVVGVANKSDGSPSSERNQESQDIEDKDCIEVEDEGYAIQRERQTDATHDLKLSLEKHDEGLEEEFLHQFAVFGVKLALDSTSAAELQKHDAMTDEEAERIKNIWFLKIEDRWRLYRLWVTKYRGEHEMELNKLNRKCEALLKEMQAVNAQEDLQILREANVVGMTTTGAARCRSVLQLLGPRIVVVEEAAEVLEAHIVTTLTAKCQHLILIGDHQQLKPNPTVYRLAKLFNLDTSLFERMINNGVPCKSLTHQHRMRPEISNLMKKHFYEKLQDDESVFNRDNIKGVQHNMFFIDHKQLEDGVDDNRTRSNQYEAKILVELCKYLLRQDYKPSQITILTTYTGQLFCLRRLMDRATFEGVRVSVVDNFQGEENDIILLSLVRSNEEGSIGFLRTTNRVCVALSRARMGFYCIGNATILKKTKLWHDITATLETEGRIGASLPLVCQNHLDKTTHVSTVKDFKEKVPDGGCDQLCGYVHPCGHVCPTFCHPIDPHHADKYKCQKPCERLCERDEHLCPLQCHQACEPCKTKVQKIISDCGHEIQVVCNEFDTVSCPLPCPRGFTDCSHHCRRQCGEECPLTCPEKCERTLSCGHDCTEECGRPCTQNCKVQVERTLKCGHKSLMDCNHNPELVRCKTRVTKTRAICGHENEMLCFQDPDTIGCKERCLKTLRCGHQCPNLCGVPCEVSVSLKFRYHFWKTEDDFKLCEKIVEKSYPSCGHVVQLPCHKDIVSLPCSRMCERQLACGHRCPKKCSKPCPREKLDETLMRRYAKYGETFLEFCREKCKNVLPCGHPCPNKCGEPCPDAGIEIHRLPFSSNEYSVKCEEPVLKQLPECGHFVSAKCYQDVAFLSCFEACDKKLPCGHKCRNLCSEPCNCSRKVLKRLPNCAHVARLLCHQDVSSYECVERCQRELACGHQCPNKCSELCPGEDEISLSEASPSVRLLRPECSQKFSVKCEEPVQKQVPKCGHFVSAKCYQDVAFLSCFKACDKKLPCGHICRNLCSEPCDCRRKVLKRLPNCAHVARLLCHQDVSSHVCVERCQRELACGHQCPNKCSELCPDEDGNFSSKTSRSMLFRSPAKEPVARQCNQLVLKKFSKCGHSIKIPCHKDVDSVKCLERCERILSCGHRCPNMCCKPCPGAKCTSRSDVSLEEFSYDSAAGKCRVLVRRKLPICGHIVELPCYENVDGVLCRMKCKRILPCGHKCPNRCGELCPGEDHNKKGHFSGSSRSSTSMTSGVTECREQVRKKLPLCGHVLTVPCGQSVDSIICRRNCSKILSCGHPCPNKCGDPCSPETRGRSSHMHGRLKRCQEIVDKVLPCGHVKSMTCWQDLSSVSCRKPCTAFLNCGHKCLGNCDNCRQGTEHVLCMRNCRKQLLCGHMCSESCGAVCSPNCKICPRRSLKERRSAILRPCRDDASMLLNVPCKHNIRHRQLKTTACILPCGKQITKCRHTCIGVCGEPCPPFCLDCKRQEVIDSLPKGGIRPRETFIYLSDCKHLCETRFLDRMVANVQSLLESGFFIIRPLLCPKCKEPIRNCCRYKNLLQTICRLVESAKGQCEERRKTVSGWSRAGGVASKPFVMGKWIRCPKGHVFYQDGDDKQPVQKRELRCPECSD